jgi:hypothetical protein
MKKHNLTNYILVCVITAFIILFCKAVYENEDSIFDILCNTSDSPLYAEFFISILLCSGILYVYWITSLSPQSVIAYLARHEKSPPGNPALSTKVRIR